jgi:hypothetical protein
MINKKTEIESTTAAINFTFAFVEIDDKDKITNITFSAEQNSHLRDIAASARLWTRRAASPNEPHYASHHSIYYDGYKPEIDELTRALKTLKTIEKKMEAMNRTRGNASAAEFAGRFAEATGCSCMVFQTAGNGAFYAQNDYRFEDIGHGVNEIKWMIEHDETFQGEIKRRYIDAA